jgi:hypothetical protein
MAGPALSFVLLERAELPDSEVLVSTARSLGLSLQVEPDSDGGGVAYAIEGSGSLLVTLMPVPHPDAEGMPSGLASPEEEALEGMTAHYVVTALGLPEDPRIRDALMAALTAAVVRASPAIAAMLGHGVVFHRAEFFTEVVETAQASLPALICVDVTIAPDGDERMSFLTHGLHRYGREEFHVTASRAGEGALDFLVGLIEWMLADPDKVLPTGDTVGRNADEKVLIQRTANPTGEGPEVIRLDLDT